MKFHDHRFGDRLSTAADAKLAALTKFQARPRPDDPTVQERRAARAAVNAARDLRAAERETARARAAEAERIARAEREAQAAVEQAARLEREALEAIEKATREAALEAERKTARDARYAARKVRR
jgi:hypothetical protein